MGYHETDYEMIINLLWQSQNENYRVIMDCFENAIMRIMKYDYEPDYCVNICIS